MANRDLVKFGGFDLEEAEENERELQRGSSNFLKLGQGRNVVRFLPPKPGEKAFVIAHQHYIEIPGAQSKLNFNCPRLMSKKPCPACARAAKLSSSGNPIDRGKADKLYPRKRVFANVISRSAPEAGVQVLAFGKQVHEQLIAIRRDMDLDFTHPQEGRDIVIIRRGAGQNDTSYKVLPAKADTPLGDMTLIDQQPDLKRFAVVPTDEELQEKMGGGSSDEEDLDEGEGYQPPKGKGKPASKASAVDDAIDAEFDE